MTTGYPVEGFPIKYTWQEGDWEKLFDEQVALIKEDIERAKAQDKMIIYLSCPISSRGGGYSGTNVEVAEFTRMRLMREWGTGFWILNPSNYQMESKGGNGLIHRHAKKLWGDQGEEKLKKLLKDSPPQGGDYMRMWTKVLVEDSEKDVKKNCGWNFDAFYFLGPTDVRSYFIETEGTSLTTAIHGYFARKFAFDADFKDAYSVSNIQWGTTSGQPLKDQWEQKRKDFFRFYSLKAGVNFSLGSHDEWNILVRLNKKRLEISKNPGAAFGDAGMQISSFFDGRQVTPADFTCETDKGYETI